MGHKKRRQPALLDMLEKAFELSREKVKPLYPYDPATNTIALPAMVEQKLRQLVLAGKKVEAVKQVTRLTGAGLRVSKDYVDSLVERP